MNVEGLEFRALGSWGLISISRVFRALAVFFMALAGCHLGLGGGVLNSKPRSGRGLVQWRYEDSQAEAAPQGDALHPQP